MTIAAEKTLQPQHVTILGATKDDRSTDPSLQDSDTAKDQSAHDALTEFGFRNHQRAQPLSRDNQCFYRILRDRVYERRTARQQRQFAQKVPDAVDDDRLVIIEMVALGDRDLT